MKIKSFEELEIWKISIEIALDIYRITKKREFRKDFGLSGQIQRAAISISSNIVEGFERSNNNEFIRFLKIAKGSAGEVRSQLFVAAKLNYTSDKEYKELSEKLFLLSNKIGRFISYLSEKRRNNEFTAR